MPLLETAGSGSAFLFSKGSILSPLIGYWDPGLASSAPTGSNGTIWKDISGNIYGMGNINIQGYSTDWTYGGSGTGAYVQNSTQRSGQSGMPIPLQLWNGNPYGNAKLRGSFSMWVYSTSYAASNGLFINRETDDANDSNWFWIGFWDAAGDFYFRTGIPEGCCSSDLARSNNTVPGGSATAPSTVVPTNTWKHLTFTWDLRPEVPLANQYKSMYVNGSLYISRTGFPGQSSATNPNGNVMGKIGSGHNTGSNSQFLGRFGVIRAFAKDLNSSEISTEFNLFRSRYGV